MSQGVFNQIIPTSTSGSQLATILNDFKDAVISGFSGTTRPTEIDPGGYWIDTSLAGSPNFLWSFKVWTGTIDIEVFKLNISTGLTSIAGSTNEFSVSKYSADANGPLLKLLKERLANNGQVLTDDIIGELQYVGGASDNTNPVVAKIKVVALDDYTASENGSYLSFEAVEINTTALTEMMRLINGKLGIGLTNPSKTLHVRGDARIEKRADDANPANIEAKKLRVSGGGQVLNNDVIGSFKAVSTDQLGQDADAAELRAVAIENHTDLAQGTEVQLRRKATGSATMTTVLRASDKIYADIPLQATDATITNLTVTNFTGQTVTQTEDPQIELNKSGTEATAQAAKAGIRIDMTDTTDYIIGFDNTKASEVVAGRAGAEKELVNVSSNQTLNGKTLQDLVLSAQDVATASAITSLSTTRSIVRLTGSTATNLQGLDATGPSKVVLIHNASSAVVTLVHDSGSATATNRLSLPNNADITVAAGSSIELFYDATATRWKLKSGSGSGTAGEGGKNYILNPNAESSTVGWATYADAAATSPVDGTGGSPNITWTRTTTTPLRGTGSFLFTRDAVNRQGEGVSYDFTIDRADQAKVLQIKFDYEIASGTYAGGVTPPLDSDLTVWIYDVTNAVLIQPSVTDLDGSVLGVQYQYRGEFQTASNSTSYRLIIHNSSTNAVAFTMEVDNVEVTPNVISRGAVITEWQNYTPTFNSGFTVGTGGGATNVFEWRRVGDEIEIHGALRLGTSGASMGAGAFSFTLPAGLTIDGNKIGNIFDRVGFAAGYDDSAASTTAGGHVNIQTSPATNTFAIASTASTGTAWNSTTPITWAAGDYFYVNLRVPIQGWGTSQTLSQDGGTRVVAARLNRATSSQALSASASDQKIQFNNIGFDTHGSYDATTNYRYTLPEAGVFEFSGMLSFAAGTADEIYAILYKNGSAFKELGREIIDATRTVSINFSTIDQGVAGNYYEIFVNTSSTAQSLLSSATIFGGSDFSVRKIQGPQQIAASETIAFRASRTGTSQTINSSAITDAVFNTRDIDTHNAFNTTTGIYTVPATGLYRVTTNVYLTNLTAGEAYGINIQRGGTIICARFARTSSTDMIETVTGLMRCVAGDTIKVTLDSAADTSYNLNNSAEGSYFEAERIGI